MIPPKEKFQEAMTKYRGNLSQVARAFSVSRHAVYDWINKNPEYKNILDDARGEFLDDVISTARVVALGIPLKDDQGNFAGYQVPPDGSMLRYLLSTLGRNEGWGEKLEIEASVAASYAPRDSQDASDYLEFLKMKYPEKTNEAIRRIEEMC